MEAKPTANSTSELRGDYSNAGADYVVDQKWESYTEDDHAIWQFLYRRQVELLPPYAAAEFVEGMERLDNGDRIPRFEEASKMLRKATGWEIVAVPGFIPETVFFDHLANRRFPATQWIRQRHELDYLVEPDLFHDFFGHVPLLSNPVFADYLQAYGERGKEAEAAGAVHMLARLYWYMVEFGLIQTPDGLKAYGAGMLSSAGETVHSLEDPRPNRIGFDLERVMRTNYLIDDFQKTYFVLDEFQDLFDATKNADFRSLYETYKNDEPLEASAVLPGDRVVHRGTEAVLSVAAE